MRFEIFLAVSVHLTLVELVLEALFLDALDTAAKSTARRPLRTLVVPQRVVTGGVFDLRYGAYTVILHSHNLRNFVNIDGQAALAADRFDVGVFLALMHATIL